MLTRSAARLASLLIAPLAALALCVSGCSQVGSASHSASQAAHARMADTASRPSSRPRPSTTPSPSTNPSTSPSTTASAAVPPAPPVGACYRLSFDELASSASSDHPYLCRKTHTTQTIYVGRLHTDAGVDSAQARAQMARVCPHRLAHYLGGDRSARHLSRFNVVWFVPSPEQAAAGAHWFRCDVIAFGRPDHLYPLPRPHRLHGILDSSAALATYGLCGTAAPGSKRFQRVACGLHHRWRAVSTIHLAGGDAYPGRHVVSAAGNSTCRDRVHAINGYSLRFSYGWEWPTRQQWRSGQHYGFCWAPG